MTDLHFNRIDVERKHRGGWAEMVACCWLLQQGYEVFRNVSSHGGIDVVAIKGLEVFKFDVKSRSDFKYLPCLTPQQRALGVQFLIVGDDGQIAISEGGPFSAQTECRNCGKSFNPRNGHQRLCSRACSLSGSAPRPCQECGVQFTPQAKRRNFCSPECARKNLMQAAHDHDAP